MPWRYEPEICRTEQWSHPNEVQNEYSPVENDYDIAIFLKFPTMQTCYQTALSRKLGNSEAELCASCR